jgi:phosphoglycerate dehydrogenase-like enzyme
MIVYTDLYNRTKNYSLTKEIISYIEEKYNVIITTKINPDIQIYWGDKFNIDLYTQMPKLEWIHLSKTGYDKFNFPENVIVTNTPKSSEGVAEYALSGILYLLRGLDRMVYNRKLFDANVDYILPFNEVKCLIVGYGNIGKKLDFLLSSLQIKTTIVDKTNFFRLNNLVKSHHFIINCLPLNPTTKECFNHQIFSSMDDTSYFINVGRGETVNENDLFEVLNSKIIRGAFLDVVQNEPLEENNPLLKLDNVFISPHIANSLYNSLDIQIKEFIFNLTNYKNNKPLINVIYDSINS